MGAFENGNMVSHETLCPGIPFGVGNAWPVFWSDIEVVVLRPAGRREVGVAHAAVAADRNGVRAWQAFLRGGPRHSAEAATQLVGQTLRRRVGQGQSAQEWMDAQRRGASRHRDRPVAYLAGIGLGGQRWEVWQHPVRFNEQSGPVRGDPPQGHAGLDESDRTQVARRKLVKPKGSEPLLWR